MQHVADRDSPDPTGFRMIVGDVFFGQKRFGHEVTFANLREHREASIRRSEASVRFILLTRCRGPWTHIGLVMIRKHEWKIS